MLAAKVEKRSLSNNSTMPKATSIKKRLHIQPTNLARVLIHSVCLYCQKYPKILEHVRQHQNSQRNDGRIISTHTFKAIVFVAVAVKVCSNKLPKPNKQPNKEQANKHKTNKSVAISAMQQNQNIIH